MIWEYCQVIADYDYEETGKHTSRSFKGIKAFNENGKILISDSYIGIFNQLGQEGWEMCGQSIIESIPDAYPNIMYKDKMSYQSCYYFKRQLDVD